MMLILTLLTLLSCVEAERCVEDRPWEARRSAPLLFTRSLLRNFYSSYRSANVTSPPFHSGLAPWSMRFYKDRVRVVSRNAVETMFFFEALFVRAKK